MTLYKLLCQNALLKQPAKVSSTESGLETRPLKCLAKMTCKSVLYRKWPQNLSCLLKCPAKMPCKSVFYKKWPRNPPSKTPCQNNLQKCFL